MTDHATWQAALEALRWQIELGADEAIGDVPVNRFETAAPAPAQSPPGPSDAARPAAQPALPPIPAATAPGTQSGPAAQTLEALAAEMQARDAGALKAGATNFCFADGRPGAPLMIIGEAPGAEEDRMGRPFVGRAGQLLDLMLAAIGLSRSATDLKRAVYITNILPWRPPGNRRPEDHEAEMFLPFVERHIELAAPDRLLLLGNTPVRTLLGLTGGITRSRGVWRSHGPSGVQAMPSFHPAYLLRQPARKKQAWADLLEIAAALDLPEHPDPPAG